MTFDNLKMNILGLRHTFTIKEVIMKRISSDAVKQRVHLLTAFGFVVFLGVLTIGMSYYNKSGASYIASTNGASPGTSPSPSPDVCLNDPQFPTQVDDHTEEGKQAADTATQPLPDAVKQLGTSFVTHLKDPSFGTGLLAYLASQTSGKVGDNVSNYLRSDLAPYSTQFNALVKQYTDSAANSAYYPLLEDLTKLDHHFSSTTSLQPTSRYASFTGDASYDISVATGAHIDLAATVNAKIVNDYIQLNAGYSCGMSGTATGRSHASGTMFADLSVNLTNTPYGDVSVTYDLTQGKGTANLDLKKSWTF